MSDAVPHGMTKDMAQRFAQIALGHVAREYPNKLDHVLVSDADVRTPRDLHPAFFGSFDWHSCVHSWWMLLHLRRMFPNMPEAAEIEALAEKTFTQDKLAAELAYARAPEARGFERPYGWAWLLALHDEAEQHSDRDWGTRLKPLATFFAASFSKYLNILSYPITVGTHFNTAFALILAHNWAGDRDSSFLKDILNYANQNYVNKRNYDGWEPGGDEFLSPALTAALLISRILPSDEFAPWFEGLVLSNDWLERECHPVSVSDRSDGKIAHLDGLNLSRAWCLWGIDKALGQGAPKLISDRAKCHFDVALPHIAGDYMGEHWLASFALLAAIERPKNVRLSD
ncbi:MAG: DUF2891 domain-containing protein [Pseudomonadota bacterium]